jgi:hypothetical protein
VNKPTLSSQITRWFLEKFDFKIVYKPGQVHFLLDHVSKISHGEPIVGLDD